MGLSSRLMDLVGRLLRLGVLYVAQQFAAIAQCDAVRLRKRCLRSHYRDLNLGAILSYEVSASVPLGRQGHCKDITYSLALWYLTWQKNIFLLSVVLMIVRNIIV